MDELENKQIMYLEDFLKTFPQSFRIRKYFVAEFSSDDQKGQLAFVWAGCLFFML